MSEGRNAESFAKNFANDPSVHIPAVFLEGTSSSIITLERIEGIKINNITELDSAGFSRPELAKQVTHIILQMVFEDGLFQC